MISRIQDFHIWYGLIVLGIGKKVALGLKILVKMLYITAILEPLVPSNHSEDKRFCGLSV